MDLGFIQPKKQNMVRIITTEAFARLVGDNASKRAAPATVASGAAAAERATARR